MVSFPFFFFGSPRKTKTFGHRCMCVWDKVDWLPRFFPVVFCLSHLIGLRTSFCWAALYDESVLTGALYFIFFILISTCILLKKGLSIFVLVVAACLFFLYILCRTSRVVSFQPHSVTRITYIMAKGNCKEPLCKLLKSGTSMFLFTQSAACKALLLF